MSFPVSDAAFAISPLTAEFRDRTVEAHFSHHLLPQSKAQLRMTVMFCASCFVLFGITDVMSLGWNETTMLLVACRILVFFIAAAGCVVNYLHPHSVGKAYLTASVTEIICLLAFALAVVSRPAELPWHAMAMSIMVLVIYLYIPNRLIYAIAIAIVSTIVFVIVALILDRLKGEEMLTMTMLLTLANGFGCIAARRYSLIRREEFRVQSVLKNLSERDPLTGCHNRRYLQQELLNMELSRARRFRLSLAVIVCDIDYFKSVNDNYGHPAGDRVLVAFANMMRGMIRENVDSLIRFGGEEFLLVLPETDLAGGMHLAERMRAALSAMSTQVAPGEHVGVTASFGVTAVNFATVSARFPQEALIELADQLLYAAKNGGRNTVRALDFHGRQGVHAPRRIGNGTTS
ncbi:diguanylate cyclase (GGDEF)-like protein [Pseudoduganella lurida]|uniref:diguanylate cyclase n=1 Tax=Pseudoduganella lurida TaxID=1036180 RepID=A0A562R5K6_9BURK|nr:GGDEF domain-containing protein [Pseudoduganella lurida]TWI64382.1 diguanylate cyclase (GGDEF)-like protein [Pseudoduganella lurida]